MGLFKNKRKLITVKIALLHTAYFVALVILSILSFLFLFGFGFTSGINIFILLIPLVLSVIWFIDYTWRILSMKQNKIELIHPTKSWSFVSLFLAGIFTVYGLFLTTLSPIPVEGVPFWLFLGTPLVLLLIWYWLLYRYIKDKSQYIQGFLGSLLFILSLIFVYHTLEFYIIYT